MKKMRAQAFGLILALSAGAVTLTACSDGGADRDSSLGSREVLDFNVLLDAFEFSEGSVNYRLGTSPSYDGAKFYCSMNGQQYERCKEAGKIPMSKIANGTNTFRVHATVDGVKAVESVARTFEYGTAPNETPIRPQPAPISTPTTTVPPISSGQSISYQHQQESREITFNTIHQGQQDVTYECQVGQNTQQQWFPCRSPIVYDHYDLGAGQHQLKVRAVRVQEGSQTIVSEYDSYGFTVVDDGLRYQHVQSVDLSIPVTQLQLSQGSYPLGSHPADIVDLVKEFANLKLAEFQVVLFNPHAQTHENLSSVELRINGRGVGTRPIQPGIGLYSFNPADWESFVIGSFLKADIESISLAFYGPEVRLVSYGAKIKRSPRKVERKVNTVIRGINANVDMLRLAGLANGNGRIKDEHNGKILGELLVTMQSTSGAGFSQVNVVEAGPWTSAPNYKNYRFLVSQVPRTYRLPINRPLGTDLSQLSFHALGQVKVDVVAATIFGHRAFRMDPVAEFHRILDPLSTTRTKVLFNVGFSTEGGAYAVPVGNDRFCGQRLTEIIVTGSANYALVGNVQRLSKLRVVLNRQGRGGQFGPGAGTFASEQWISPVTRQHSFVFKDSAGNRGVYLDCSGPYRLSVADLQLIGGGSVNINEVFAVIEP